jgi:endonuclease/exonuclease/phosphatase family metal-dependent hydrolase
MVTWVKLRDRQQESRPPLVFFNTHFDHQGPTARLESARLLRQQIRSLGKDCAIIVTGDFNTDQDSPPYEVLFGPDAEHSSPIVDSYRTAHPDKEPDEGTFSGFQASGTSGERIDWIGVSRDWLVTSAAIDRTAWDGRTPSDHFPVTAVLRPRP